MTPERPEGPERKDGLWAPARRGLTIGLVLTITFIASEALAVVTVMPVVARDLGGLSLYGWVFSTFMLGSLVGIVVAGRDADRHGPARPYLVGLVLFAAGLVVAGLAPTMVVLVVGRALQGFGAGAVPAVAYVAIGRSLPETLRPRMMAVLSTAWVVPGIVGPALAAAVAHLFGWRWVFLGLVPLVAVAGPLALPALLQLGKVETAASTEHRVTDGIRAAAGAALFLAALDTRQLGSGLALGIAGALVGVPALRRLLPAGTLAARPGLPTTILSRGLLTFAFFGADAYVTLSITTVRHHSILLAGAVVTSSTLAWTAGAWVQAHVNDRWEGRRLVRAGLTCILIGIAGMIVFLRPGVPLAVAFGSWTVAGFGMGLSYAPISLMMLRVAPSGREGWASASLNLADVLGTALGVGVGGAAVAAVSRGARPVSGGVTLAYAAAPRRRCWLPSSRPGCPGPPGSGRRRPLPDPRSARVTAPRPQADGTRRGATATATAGPFTWSESVHPRVTPCGDNGRSEAPEEIAMAKIRRNAPCPCGSGAKAKRCCYGINQATEVHCLPTELCRGVVPDLIGIDEVELMVLEEDVLDLPEIDTSLQVPLGILTPTIESAIYAIQDDDVDLLDDVFDEVVLEVDWPDRRIELAQAVIRLRDQGRIPSDLAAMAVIDLDGLESAFFVSSVAESLAVLAGQRSTPAGLIVAAP